MALKKIRNCEIISAKCKRDLCKQVVNLVLLFSLTSFIAAFLIFLVQPMIGKMLLPLVGGVPAVWNTCMFFFQLLILAGYSYTHFSLRKLGVRRQSIVHLVIVAGTLFFLPLQLNISEAVPENPSIWLLVKLVQTAALPFFLLATLSPLLQVWFSRSGHAEAQAPFFLYAASNVGSFAALLLYPLFIEARFNLAQQSRIWLAGYLLLLVLIAFCRWQVKADENSDIPVETRVVTPPPQRLTIEHWVVAAFIPSSLLLGVTLFISIDLAAVPLLWVVPLMIYLATFVMAFSSYNLPFWLVEKLAIFSILIFPLSYFIHPIDRLLISIPMNLAILFAISLYCHSYLAKTRPGIDYLTSFYTWVSLGGVLGGLFNSLIAPNLFSDFTEYPLVILITCLFMYSAAKTENQPESPAFLSGFAALTLTGVIVSTSLLEIDDIDLVDYFRKLAMLRSVNIVNWPWSGLLWFLRGSAALLKFGALFIVATFPAYLLRPDPKSRLFIFSFAAMVTLFVCDTGQSNTVLFQSRNFFGKKRVALGNSEHVRTLTHGSTFHGMQVCSGELKNRPLMYYHFDGPAGDIFALPVAGKPDLKACVIGLGAGAMAAYSRPGQEFTFIEIDPEIISLVAESDLLFSYISDNASQCRIICGDGRLKILEEPEEKFDIIFVDAFSSDAIPTHLLTSEAVSIYFSRLKNDGLVAFNISNRYLSLKRVLQAIASTQNLVMMHVMDNEFNSRSKENRFRDYSEYVVLSRSLSSLNGLLGVSNKTWSRVDDVESAGQMWTDSYSSLLPLLRSPAFWH